MDEGKTANAKWFLWAQWSGIFILILIFFRFLVEIDGQADPLRLALWISAFVKFFPIHHGLKQISGISLIYNQKLKLAISDDQKTIKFMACERREKNLFFFLILSLVFAPLGSILFPGNLYASSCLPFLGGVFVFAIIWNSMRYPYVEKSNKTYFLMRLLFYPLSQYTFFGFFFTGATHGTEYLGVYHKMYMSSKVKGLRSLIALIILTAVVVILLVANPYQGLHWLLVQHFPSQIGVIKWLAAMTVSLTFMHYYLDRCLFKMREPIVRDNIGPLLLGPMQEGQQGRWQRLA
jgi:hypothetical protein